MSLFLDTSGNSNLGIGLCARCSRKMPLGELRADPNYPGLMVCDEDRDQYDPYRLPARPTEALNLPFVRPDLPVSLTPDQEVQTVFVTEDDHLMTSEDDVPMSPNP